MKNKNTSLVINTKNEFIARFAYPEKEKKREDSLKDGLRIAMLPGRYLVAQTIR